LTIRPENPPPQKTGEVRKRVKKKRKKKSMGGNTWVVFWETCVGELEGQSAMTAAKKQQQKKKKNKTNKNNTKKEKGNKTGEK